MNARDAELDTLAALTINPLAIEQVAKVLTPADFHAHEHQDLYAAMLQMHGNGEPPRLEMLYLRHREEMEAVGYGELIGRQSVYALDVLHYARAVRDLANRRRVQDLGSTLLDSVQTHDPSAAIAKAQEAIRALSRREPAPLPDSRGFLDTLYREMIGEIEPSDEGVSTGLHALAGKVPRLVPGDFIIIAARPGVGKTSLALTISWHVAVKLREPVLFISLEMTQREMWGKLYAIHTDIPFRSLRTRTLTPDQRDKVLRAKQTLEAAPIQIFSRDMTLDGVPADHLWSVAHIREIAEHFHRDAPLALVVVDYIQLVTEHGRKENRTQAVSAISSALKGMAMEMHVPVMGNSQLNRALEPNGNRVKSRKPTMSDLRESGALEQDANIVLLLSHPEDYDPDTAPVRQDIICIVGKNRLGETGELTLGFYGDRMKFVDPAHVERLPPPLPKPTVAGREAF